MVDVARTTLERERVRRAFGAYVAEPVVEQVLAGNLAVATERRHVTVMFVDIRNFTRFSRARPPTEVLDRLNLALERFSREVHDRDGIVNKFLGDGLMALFGAPLDRPDHCHSAGQAALAIARAAEDLATSGVYPELRVGIGLHTGEVLVGDVGGDGHREYTAIGDVVNVASRVEDQCKRLGATVLATEAVCQHLGPDVHAREAGVVELRGRADEPMRLSELLPEPQDTGVRAT